MSMISAFYNGKSILITGATGFLGKVMMEKLLRTSPDLKVIYILVRPKAGQTLQQRVFQILNSKLFEKVKEVCPKVHEKIRAISADLNQHDLAISKEDMQELLSHTNIIFHCAATVRFDDHLRHAVQLNVTATQQLLSIASQMPKLEAFIHISTAFANCNLKHIDEVIYPCAVEPKKIIDSMEWLDDAIIDEITPKLIGDRPNTYTYTKALGEMVLQQEGGNLNIAIIRPSIVGATWQEPFPGWIDSINGPTGLIVAAGKGFLRSIRATPMAVADLIPVDLVINLTLAVGWYTAVHRPKSTLIYHCTSGNLNPCHWGKMGFQVLATFEKIPFEKAFRRPNADFTTNNITTHYWNAVSHRVPAIIYDVYLRLTGRKPRMTKVMNRLLRTLSMLEYFINRSWEWSTYNTEMLMSELSPEDQRVFNFDVRQLNWLEYIENYVLGVKKYLLKEDMAGIPEARQHLKRLRNIHYLFNTALFLIAWRLLIARSQVARNVWFFIVSFCYKLLSYFRASSRLKV
ncbi:fatty acyl-CoA reductase 2 [Camelus dromedarius]|uniref:Fatty acyl-CoA reductase n=5 Tax=Camelus TaxID=9836 RepID=A0A8B8SIY3_CAMFR|nr:fatty acyl-CoA reductase 2 [Camelus dromedarius]XP_014422654.1 fatty acyl-CoA reductase 2 isoform X1 [Camelus ferus]XP_031299723.1 fatty acyl-CoA reductase 2 [Camelus dromedarius]XP_031299724.1 fatty acyl-CoA reductase 2 [Camelus dromedarius]XP_031299725.1 fatty acyl-CoA reductase 2 [Camelus dromedarius]XP_032329292.1 fatty acyl-CoA reductase 2 isoform X1 [Camelus ferus]XP_032329293.1 fatty acyl-CoA reductase 2 isoform X1 [Camelus ferus]XP_032329294.1 fatty acyl-CoA reductase 2 isoform X1